MKIKLGGRQYEIADTCPVDSPSRRTLNRFLRTHGPESLITSQQHGRMATCVLQRLIKEGVEVVEPKGNGHSATTSEKT